MVNAQTGKSAHEGVPSSPHTPHWERAWGLCVPCGVAVVRGAFSYVAQVWMCGSEKLCAVTLSPASRPRAAEAISVSARVCTWAPGTLGTLRLSAAALERKPVSSSTACQFEVEIDTLYHVDKLSICSHFIKTNVGFKFLYGKYGALALKKKLAAQRGDGENCGACPGPAGSLPDLWAWRSG